MAKKAEKKECPECPPCNPAPASPVSPGQRPDVSSIKGPVVKVKEGRKESAADREVREQIESGEREVIPSYGPIYPYKPGKDRFSFPEFGYWRKTAQQVCDLKSKTANATVTMVTDAEAKVAGILPGPALRLCFEAKKPGVLVPVGTPDEATSITRDFLDCVRDPSREERGNPKACAVNLSSRVKPNEPVVLGKTPRSRRKADK
jgi:hypothetical protein